MQGSEPLKLFSLSFHFELSNFLWYSDNFLFYFLILVSFLFEFIHEGLWLISKLLNLLIDCIEMIGLWCILKEIVSFNVHIDIFDIWVLVWWIGLLIWNWWEWESIFVSNVGFIGIGWGRFRWFFEGVCIVFVFVGVIFVLFNITGLLEIIQIWCFFFWEL